MDIFQVLAEPRRRNIVEMLATRGSLTATAISDRFNVSPPAISQHLKVLLDAHLVRMEKQGRERIYDINPEAMDKYQEWFKKVHKMYTERFDRLDLLLKRR
ncbi:MAG TPA: metalloregulator ArsR/SmtB family transcription factor [Patescibacteria group bacterium]